MNLLPTGHFVRSFGRKLLAVLLLALAALTGCKPSQQAKNDATDPAEAYSITLGSGGGFTGIYTGFRMRSSGIVERWQQSPGGADSVLQSIAGSPATVDSFSQQLRRSGAFAAPLAGSGNITYFLEYAGPDTTMRWTWGQQPEGSRGEPGSPAEQMYRILADYLRTMFDSPSH